MEILETVNGILSVLIMVLLCTHVIFPLRAIFPKKKSPSESFPRRRYAVLICARNEEAVIGNLLRSLERQNYPRELFHVCVLADNCTDGTAEVARKHGAQVFVRRNEKKVGKGYALNFLYDMVILENGDIYDGFFVFDADNILPEDFISRMDRSFRGGNTVLTGIRNSTNFGENFISASYAVGWLYQTALMNVGRNGLGISSFVNGTGFLVGSQVLRESDGWQFFTLTEDCEFSVYCTVHNIGIGICEAEFFDEQPTDFSSSWKQRLRWMRGNLQVFAAYGKKLLSGIFSRRGFSFFDAFTSVVPTSFLLLVSGVLTLIQLFLGADTPVAFLTALLSLTFKAYLYLLAFGLLTVFLCWRRISVAPWRKILLTLYYPIHVVSFIPITVAALFTQVDWAPVRHRGRYGTVEEITGKK